MALTDIVKAYDVRGLVDGQLTEEVVRALGAAFADEVGTAAPIVIGHDMRPSSPVLAAAAADGARTRGADVLLIGLCSTDGTYFASGALDAPAMMFTASHNPAAYNGIKFSRAGARGVSLDTGLATIRDGAQRYLDAGIPEAPRRGDIAERDVLADYAAHVRSLVDLSRIRPLKVVVDAANGMGGLTVPAVLGDAAGLGALPLEIVPLYFELDGTFPNHEANPLDPKNLVDLQAAVVEHGADLGLAFDGDADRCFVIDERGGAVSPSAVAAIVAEREIARVRAEGETDIVVLHNLITSRVVPEVIAAAGATPVRTRVGHSLIKDKMAETGAVFGGEHSAHYYFRDFWGADNGMLAAMHVLATLGADAEPMSELAARYSPYAASGEINSTVADVPAAYTRIVEAFAGRGEFDELDGLTVTAPDGAWWFSVRPSNTEPLLRLNAEAEQQATLDAIRDEVLALIRA
ncbi:phosphomannomutase/phosphoglucomutase [Agrococcus citreus]|uniref:Phosphomannomutase/phosphoglucomutase n=1 Tax=Agrococcus citreus TaxID=84643 RepID=A0ABP4JNB7_9MICO